ncbi:MAG: AmmeMemoRadiSam system protein B [Desulfatiglandales bacterium]
MNRPLALFFLICLALHAVFVEEGEAKSPEVRPPMLAGTWYPTNADDLRKSISAYLSGPGPASLEGDIRGLVVPHAGHVYSGRVAGSAYRLLKDRPIRRVVMIGPSHRAAFKGISVNLQSAYETPLGNVPVDQAMGKRLLATCPEIKWLPRAHSHEHALEIQLPFLQSVLKDFHIVPLIMGQQDLETCRRLAQGLLTVIDFPETTLFLASTDLSHFHNSRQAETLDRLFIQHIRNFDPLGLSRALASGDCEACGGGPAVAVMLATQGLGAGRSTILDYAHSGHITGDLERVVGYLSAAFMQID